MKILAYKNNVAVFFLLLFLLSWKAQAAVLLDASFVGTSPSLNTPWTATDSIDPNLNYSGWMLTWSGVGSDLTGTRPYAVDNAFGFDVCPNTGAYNNTLDEAVRDNQYIYFRISPKSGSLNLNNKKIIFQMQRYEYLAPLKYSVFTSVGGFQAGVELFTGSVSGNGDYAARTFEFIMPETGYDNIAGDVEFRIYAYESSFCYKSVSLNEFIIQDAGPLHYLSLSGTAGGTVTSIPEGTRFEEGTVVQLSATPDPGYHFAGWSGDVSGKGNPRSVTITSDLLVTANFAANVNSKVQVGMNLAGINDWATSEAFVDAFKMFRTWITQEAGSTEFDSGKGDEVPTDLYGWPTHVPFTASDGTTQYVHTILVEPLAGGDYKFIVTGTGKIEFNGAIKSGIIELSGGTTEYTLPIPPGNDKNLGLFIHESQSNDPVRDIKIIRPEYISTYETQTFQPLYLNVLEPFDALRYLGWEKTNGSPVDTWDDRTLKESYTQTRRQGVALEYIVELANTLSKDLWINIPHMADDDYVRQAARLLRDTVGPNQKIYVEYSNETWNNHRDFTQTTYVRDEGVKLWPELTNTLWVAGDKYTALRSVQIWKIFQEEFSTDARVVRVLATQAANAAVTRNRVDALNEPAINPDYLMPDVLAIAPYFGHNYTPDEITASGYPTVDDILNVTAPASIAEQQSNVRAHKEITDAQGMELVCYEAGQHFVGILGAENDTVLTDTLIAANRDNRMYQRYADYLAMLDAEGISTCAFFAEIDRPDKWGSWGVLEYLEQPISEAPKYLALVDFITEPADLSVASAVNPSTVYLNDTLTYTFTIINNGPTAASNVTLTDTLPSGVAFVSATPQDSCTHDNGTVTCNLDSLASGASTTVTITVTATVTGTLSNTASVTGSGTDPNPGNNTATATVTVIAPELVPTALSALKQGKTVYVSDEVQNQGDGTAGAFTVAYYLSTNTTYDSGTDIPLASSSDGSGICTRSIASLAPGASDSASNQVCYKPAGAQRKTSYYVLTVADNPVNQVNESDEANNVRATMGQIRW